MTFTRRTHMVRIYQDGSDAKNPGPYIDVEVLDTIAFRTANNKEMVLKTTAKDAVVYCKDDTGNDLGKDPGSGATRATHVTQLKSDDGSNKLLIEVLDRACFRDQNNNEWVLVKLNDDNVYNSTTGDGPANATRRVHNEKKSASNPGGQPKDTDTDYVTVQRCDTVAFRGPKNKEMIVSLPSYDDGKGKRASTYISNMPDGYDPADPNSTPPENKDPHFYVKIKSGTNFFLQKKEIKQGPLWWIRKIKSGHALLYVTVTTTSYLDTGNTPPSPSTVTFPFMSSAVKLLDSGNGQHSGQPTVIRYVASSTWIVYISPPAQQQFWYNVSGTWVKSTNEGSINGPPGPVFGVSSWAEFQANWMDQFGNLKPNAPGFIAQGTQAVDQFGNALTDPNLYHGLDPTPSYFDSNLGGFHYQTNFFPGMTPEQEALCWQNAQPMTFQQMGDNTVTGYLDGANYTTYPNTFKAQQILNGAETTTIASFLFEIDAPSEDPCLTINVAGWPSMDIGSAGSITATLWTKPFTNPDGSQVKTLDDYYAFLQTGKGKADNYQADDAIVYAANANTGPIPGTFTIGVKPDPNTPPSWPYWEIFSPQEPLVVNGLNCIVHPSTGRSPDI